MRSRPWIRALAALVLLLAPAASATMAAAHRPAGCCATGARACCCRPGSKDRSCRIERPCGTSRETGARSAAPAPALIALELNRIDLCPLTPVVVVTLSNPAPIAFSPPDPPPEPTA